jgi:hypothetical protein
MEIEEWRGHIMKIEALIEVEYHPSYKNNLVYILLFCEGLI